MIGIVMWVEAKAGPLFDQRHWIGAPKGYFRFSEKKKLENKQTASPPAYPAIPPITTPVIPFEITS